VTTTPQPAAAPTTLAERRRLQTKDEIASVAIRLFTDDGFDETSMEDVADKAGVSRRTVYRHFATKADLVFEHPRRWLAHYESVLADNASSSARGRCERAILEIAQMIAADPEPVLAAFAVRNANPVLGATHSSSDAKWVEQTFHALIAEHGPEASLQCMVCAGALTGATNALIVAWSLAHPNADLVAMAHATLEQVEALWPNPNSKV